MERSFVMHLPSAERFAVRPPDEHAPCLAMSETTGVVSSGSDPIAARSISEHFIFFGSRSGRSRLSFSAGSCLRSPSSKRVS